MMKSVRRVLLSTAAIAGLMALTATTNTSAIEPGYGPDAPSRESVEQSRESTGGDTGSATGGESGYATGGETGSGCSRKGASGTGAGGAMDETGRSQTEFSGSAGTTGPGAAGNVRAPGTSSDNYPGR